MLQKRVKIGNRGVSTIVGYALTLALCSMILTSTTFIVSTYATRRNESAAKIEAQAIANRIVSLLSEIVSLKQTMSTQEISYQKTMELPNKLATYYYYVEVTDTAVTVKTTNGQISESCTLYNIAQDVDIVNSINSAGNKVYGGSVIKVSIDALSAPVDLLVEGT